MHAMTIWLNKSTNEKECQTSISWVSSQSSVYLILAPNQWSIQLDYDKSKVNRLEPPAECLHRTGFRFLLNKGPLLRFWSNDSFLGVNSVDHVNPNGYSRLAISFSGPDPALIIVILRVVELVKHTRFYSR